MDDIDFEASVLAEAELDSASSLPLHEFRYRRSGWNMGTLVCLADRTLWHLPRLDLAVLLTTPELPADLSQAVAIAERIELAAAGSHNQSLRSLDSHAHMATVGGRLLQANDDLPDASWRSLIKFDGLAPMLVFTSTVSLEVARSSSE